MLAQNAQNPIGTQQLQQIESQLQATKDREKALSGTIEAILQESRVLSERLVAMAARVQAREVRITAGEERLGQLDLEEQALRAQLKRRRNTLSHLLAGLQRLEQDPPPALVVKSDDALGALRGAMLLGAIVPELKEQAQAVASSLNRLINLRAAIKREREELENNLTTLAKERGEIEVLLAKKTTLEAQARKELKTARARESVLTKHAKTIRGLMKEIETDLASRRKARREEEKARLAEIEEEKRQAEQERIDSEKRRVAALLRPKLRFTKTKGQLSYPVQGEVIANYGSREADGNQAKGITLATRPNAQVIAPAAGKIEFAGEFRTYGRLLIINAGEGYYLLLAGLGEITVNAGQAIAAGEPVGTMGNEAALGVVGSDKGDGRPILYVEFRRNDDPIDPRPWWAGRNNSKVRG